MWLIRLRKKPFSWQTIEFLRLMLIMLPNALNPKLCSWILKLGDIDSMSHNLGYVELITHF